MIKWWDLAQGHHQDRIDLLLARTGVGGVEVAKHNLRLTCNLVNKATWVQRYSQDLRNLITKDYANEGSQNKTLELSSLHKYELSNLTPIFLAF
jgi:hypothetical protein